MAVSGAALFGRIGSGVAVSGAAWFFRIGSGVFGAAWFSRTEPHYLIQEYS